MSYTSIAVFLPSDHIFLPPTHYCLVAKKLPCWEFFVGVASEREESLLRPSALGRALGTPVSQNCFSPHPSPISGQIHRTPVASYALLFGVMNPVRSRARDRVASPKDRGAATSNGMNVRSGFMLFLNVLGHF